MKWMTTARVIAMTLLPGKKREIPFESAFHRALPAVGGEFISVPETQLSHLNDFRTAVNDKQQLRLFFKDCLAPAAPFLLFRLKRQGFSQCRAQATREGIYLSAER